MTLSLTLYFTKKRTYYFHMRHTLVLSISRLHLLSNTHDENVKIQKCIFENVKIENVQHYKMFFRVYYNMKFILPCH